MSRPILFLFLVVAWGAVAGLVYLILFTRDQEQYQVLHTGMELFGRIGVVMKNLFRFSDHWNWLSITFMFAVGVVVFCLNDVVLKRMFIRWLDLHSSEFYTGGVIWSVRMMGNTVLLFIQIIVFAYIVNTISSSPRIYTTETLEGDGYTVLLLGTSKYLRGTEHLNKYYQERIDAVVRLYSMGKINAIVISGDHTGKEYSEPLDMQADLIKQGVPKNLIQLDLNGYRTFDSIQRLSISQSNTLLIVSQYFHLERALYLARSNGVHAFGVAAEGGLTMDMFKREMFAKTKVLLDIYILNTQAYGLAAHPRRAIDLHHTPDAILLSFVLGVVFFAGRLSQNLLYY